MKQTWNSQKEKVVVFLWRKIRVSEKMGECRVGTPKGRTRRNCQFVESGFKKPGQKLEIENYEKESEHL